MVKERASARSASATRNAGAGPALAWCVRESRLLTQPRPSLHCQLKPEGRGLAYPLVQCSERAAVASVGLERGASMRLTQPRLLFPRSFGRGRGPVSRIEPELLLADTGRHED